MKIFHTVILCLCAISTYAQQNINDGNYTFQDESFTTLDYNTRSVVTSGVVVSNPALIDSTDMFLKHVLLELTLADGVISTCTLANQVEYVVVNGVLLVPAKTYDSSLVYDENGIDGEDGKRLPPYTTSISGNTLTLTFIFLYGDSRYNFTLEGNLVVTLTKQ